MREIIDILPPPAFLKRSRIFLLLGIYILARQALASQALLASMSITLRASFLSHESASRQGGPLARPPKRAWNRR